MIEEGWKEKEKINSSMGGIKEWCLRGDGELIEILWNSSGKLKTEIYDESDMKLSDVCRREVK